MEESPLKLCVEVELRLKVSPDLVDEVSRKMKDLADSVDFYEGKLNRGDERFNLAP